METKAILLDFETLGDRPGSVILDLAAVVFDLNGNDNFEDLINDEERTFRVKFEVTEQVKKWKRTIDKSTVEWWRGQGDKAKRVIQPDPKLDVNLEVGMGLFKEFVERTGVYNKKTLGYVRGQSFDFPILVDIVHSIWPELDYTMFPVAFWNQRDVRTAIAHDLCTPLNTKCPLPEGMFEGFIAHNSIHDCVRDVISLQHANGYKNGTIEVPEKFQFY